MDEVNYCDTNTSSELQILKTNRGSEKLCFKGYLYVAYRKCKEHNRWICAQKQSKKCKGQLLTNLNSTNPRTVHEHNHSPTPMEKILATKAMQEMKRLYKETGATPQKILVEAVKGLDSSILAHLPSKDSAMRSIRYMRTANEKRKLKEMVQYVNAEVDTQAFMQAQQFVENSGEFDGGYLGHMTGDTYNGLGDRYNYNIQEEGGSNSDASSQIKVTNSKITDEQWDLIMNCLDSNSLLLKEEVPSEAEAKQISRLWGYLTGVLNSEKNGCKKNAKNWQKAFEDYKTQLMWTVDQQDKWSTRDHKLYMLITKCLEEQNARMDEDTNSTETSVTQGQDADPIRFEEKIISIKCELEEEEDDFSKIRSVLNRDECAPTADRAATDPKSFKIFATEPKQNLEQTCSKTRDETDVVNKSTDRHFRGGANIGRNCRRKYSFSRRISQLEIRERRRRNKEMAANTAAILAQADALKELTSTMKLVAESNFKLAESYARKT